MPASFRSKGAFGSGTTSCTAAMPTAGDAPQNNDIILIVVESADSNTTGGTPNTPSGYSKIFEETQGEGATGVSTLTIFAKRSSGSESNVTIDGVGNHVAATALVFKDAITTGTAWVVGTGGGGTSGSGDIPAVTTGEADNLIIACVGTTRDAAATNSFTSWANSNFTPTEREDNTTNSGNGGGIGVADAVFTGSGSSGNVTVTITGAAYRYVLIALKPIPTSIGTLGQPHFRIRTGDTVGLTADSGWAAALDTNASIDAETPFRIRFEVDETASISTSTAFKLQWRKNAGAWTDAAAPGFPVASSTPAVAYYPSSQYSDGASLTTNLLSGSGLTFVNGTAETSNNTASITLNNQHTEIEVCVMIRRFYDNKGKNVSGDDFEFRLVQSSGSAFTGTYVIPSINLTIPAGLLAGVFTETPNQVGPLKDGNGNLYCFIEYAETNAKVMIIKSTDGGDTWLPMDESNAPVDTDLESASMVLENDRLYIAHENNSVKHHVYRVSTHATNPDTWETIDEEVLASNGGSDQCCDIARRSDGDLVIFYVKLSTSDRLFYKIKPSGGSWGTEQTLESQAGSDWRGVACARGANDKIHIIYGGTSGNRYHKSLDSSDVLSARELLTSDGGTLNAKSHGHLQPVYHDASGTEKVLVSYQRNDNRIYSRMITNDGTPGTEAQTTLNTIYSKATSREPAARTSVQGTTHHIIYSDESTGDGFYDKTTSENTWGTDVEFLDGKTIDLISGTIFTHSAGNGGGTVFGFIYANGTNGYTGDVWYGEKTLATGHVKSVDGAITPSGAISKQAGKVVDGTIISSGTVAKAISTFVAGTLTSAGAVLKQASKSFAGTLTSSGALQTARIFLKALEGTLTLAGTVTKQTGKIVGGTLTSAGALIKQAQKNLGSILSSSGTLTTSRIFLKVLEGTLTLSGALTKQAQKVLSGTVTSAGTLTKQAGKALSGAISSIVGSLSKTTSKSFEGTLTSSGGTNNQTSKSFGGSITPSGTTTKQAGKAFSGTLTLAGQISKQANKALSGTLTLAGTIVKQTNKFLSGVLTSAGSLATQLFTGGQTFFKDLSGTLDLSGTVNKLTSKTFAGALTSSGAIVKMTLKSFSGTLTSSGTLLRNVTFAKVIEGTLAMSGALSKSTGKLLSGTLTSVGSLAKQTSKFFSGVLSSAGTLTVTKTFIKVLEGTMSFSGSLVKQINKSLGGSVSMSGTISRAMSKLVSGTLSLSGTVNKFTTKFFSGTLTSSGILSAIYNFIEVLSKVYLRGVRTFSVSLEGIATNPLVVGLRGLYKNIVSLLGNNKT